MDREPDWIWWDEARAVARRHARGASDAADDLAQELVLAALERGEAPRRPGAWLERVGRNAEIDRWRGARRRGELAADVDVPAPSPDPEARVLLRERRGVVRRALASLPRPLRRAALARFHADLPFDDVAARLGTRAVTARTRVHRALERLRATVGGLRAFFVWLPRAQATVLGATLVAGVARPALFPVASAPLEGASPSVHARRVAQASAPVTSPAPAPRPAPARVVGRAPRVEALPSLPTAVQRFSYDDDEVTGELAGPDGSDVWGEPVVRQSSLIELRWTFAPEIVKTLEDL